MKWSCRNRTFRAVHPERSRGALKEAVSGRFPERGRSAGHPNRFMKIMPGILIPCALDYNPQANFSPLGGRGLHAGSQHAGNIGRAYNTSAMIVHSMG